MALQDAREDLDIDAYTEMIDMPTNETALDVAAAIANVMWNIIQLDPDMTAINFRHLFYAIMRGVSGGKLTVAEIVSRVSMPVHPDPDNAMARDVEAMLAYELDMFFDRGGDNTYQWSRGGRDELVRAVHAAVVTARDPGRTLLQDEGSRGDTSNIVMACIKCNAVDTRTGCNKCNKRMCAECHAVHRITGK